MTMDKRPGRQLRVAVSANGADWFTVSTTTDTFAISAETVGVTDSGGPWRELLPGCGTLSALINCAGYRQGGTDGATAWDLCRSALEARAVIFYRIFSGGESSPFMSGLARVVGTEISADHNGAERFALTMTAAGPSLPPVALVPLGLVTGAPVLGSPDLVELPRWLTGSVLWPMDEGTGTTFYDEDGGNTITLQQRAVTKFPPVANVETWESNGYVLSTRTYSTLVPRPGTGRQPEADHGFVSVLVRQPSGTLWSSYGCNGKGLRSSSGSNAGITLELGDGANPGPGYWYGGSINDPDGSLSWSGWTHCLISWHTLSPGMYRGKVYENGSLLGTRDRSKSTFGTVDPSFRIGSSLVSTMPCIMRNLRAGTVGDRELTDAEAMAIFTNDAL
jgi:predicted secreted protein